MSTQTARRLGKIVGLRNGIIPDTPTTSDIVRDLRENYLARDRAALTAIRDPKYPGRHWIIRSWLHEYSVIRRTWKTKLKVSPLFQAEKTVNAALKYVDKSIQCQSGRPGGLTALTRDNLVAYFDELEGHCEAVTGIDQVSLASKILWLCFPNAAPMYDSFARTALNPSIKGTLSARSSSRKYEAFIRDWFELYDAYRLQTEAFALSAGVFPIRTFDWALMRASPIRN
nr:hypothetical protein [uncultured Dongia sp.]